MKSFFLLVDIGFTGYDSLNSSKAETFCDDKGMKVLRIFSKNGGKRFMNAKKKVKKEPTLFLALTPVVLTVIILIFSVSVLKVDVQVPLILGTCITAFIAIVFMGYTWQDLEDGAIESLKSIMQAVLLLIIIGATIGTWIVGGIEIGRAHV